MIELSELCWLNFRSEYRKGGLLSDMSSPLLFYNFGHFGDS